MTRQSDAQAPLLNAVARKLGQAAGTLASMTHMLRTGQPTRPSQPASRPESSHPKSASKDKRGQRAYESNEEAASRQCKKANARYKASNSLSQKHDDETKLQEEK
jgi:hypothetical protein